MMYAIEVDESLDTKGRSTSTCSTNSTGIYLHIDTLCLRLKRKQLFLQLLRLLGTTTDFMYLFHPIGSMQLVYLPTFTINIYPSCR